MFCFLLLAPGCLETCATCATNCKSPKRASGRLLHGPMKLDLRTNRQHFPPQEDGSDTIVLLVLTLLSTLLSTLLDSLIVSLIVTLIVTLLLTLKA